MREKNPDMVAGEKRKFVMKPPQVVRVGTKKTSFVNFTDICKLWVALLPGCIDTLLWVCGSLFFLKMDFTSCLTGCIVSLNISSLSFWLSWEPGVCSVLTVFTISFWLLLYKNVFIYLFLLIICQQWLNRRKQPACDQRQIPTETDRKCVEKIYQ